MPSEFRAHDPEPASIQKLSGVPGQSIANKISNRYTISYEHSFLCSSLGRLLSAAARGAVGDPAAGDRADRVGTLDSEARHAREPVASLPPEAQAPARPRGRRRSHGSPATSTH